VLQLFKQNKQYGKPRFQVFTLGATVVHYIPAHTDVTCSFH